MSGTDTQTYRQYCGMQGEVSRFIYDPAHVKMGVGVSYLFNFIIITVNRSPHVTGGWVEVWMTI